MKQLFNQLKNIYMNLKLQHKITLSHLMIVIVPMILMAFIFYGKIYDMIVAETIRNQQNTSTQTGPELNALMEKIVQAGISAENTDFYTSIFHNSDSSDWKYFFNQEAGQEYLSNNQELIHSMPINTIRVFLDLPTDHALFSDDLGKQYFSPLLSAKGTYWYGIFSGTHCTSLHCPSFYLNSTEKSEYGSCAYIKKSVISWNNKSTPVYTAVYYSSDIFLSILEKNVTAENSVAYIINDRETTVASTSSALDGTYHFSYSDVKNSFLSSNNFIEKTVLGETVYAGFYRIAEPEWFLVVVIPSNPLIRQSAVMMGKYSLIYLTFILIAVMIAILISRSVTNRISSVIFQMRAVRQGNLYPMPSSEYHDEIGDLIDTYNYMTRKLNQLMEDQARSAENLRIAEFDALQAQINPHFLYNTMEMINWLAQQGKTSEVSDAIQNLSRFYKLTLSRKSTISTIEMELEHISIYVHLQNMRFHNGIELVIDIPDEMLEYHIPKLTLQPVIENAILHGIMEKESKSGSIVITGWLESNDAVLLISDDGIGMSDEQLKHILSGTGISKKGTNIAIYNTHQRLTLLYGPHYGLSYSSVQGVGTEVQIRIPN